MADITARNSSMSFMSAPYPDHNLTPHLTQLPLEGSGVAARRGRLVGSCRRPGRGAVDRAEDLRQSQGGPEGTPGSGLLGLGQVRADQVTDGMPPSDPGVVKRSSAGVCPPVGVART